MKPKRQKGKTLKTNTSEIIEGLTVTARPSETAEVTSDKLEIRKQLVLSRILDEKVKRYLLKTSFEQNRRISFNGLIIEILEGLTKDIKLD